MNLIVDRRLDPAERRLIQALTLKKRQSKKSHMSEKQVLARQQLADELLQVRKPQVGYTRSQSQLASLAELEASKCGDRQSAKHLLMRQSKSSASLLRHHQLANSGSHQFLAGASADTTTTASCCCAGDTCACNLSESSSHLSADPEPRQERCADTSKAAPAPAPAGPNSIASHCDTTHLHHNLGTNANHRHQQHHHRISSVGSSCSFSRSDSSYSGSSQDSGAQMHMILEKQPTESPGPCDTTKGTYSELESTTGAEVDDVDDKEAAIKFNKSRLERLNAELEKRLYQYEYLVAQEKALLGTYNLMLFTSEGVNNFAY